LDYDSYVIYKEDLEMGQPRLLTTDKPLLLPKGLHIRFLITSDDVLHSFAVPAFGLKVDAVPGRLHQLSVLLKDTGTYYGQCSELCGANHGFMPIEIIVLSPKQYFNYLYLV